MCPRVGRHLGSSQAGKDGKDAVFLRSDGLGDRI